MGLFTALAKPKKLPTESMNSFLPVTEYPAKCPVVVAHMREAIKKHTGTHWPLYLFFDIKPLGTLPQEKPWDRWDPDALDEPELAEYPHIMQFAWILADEKQHVYMARNALVKPEHFQLPDNAFDLYGISHSQAHERGAPIADLLDEFCYCLAPATRIITFNGAVEGVTLEVEMRRHKMPFHFNRQFFYDLRERAKPFCALYEPAADEYQSPRLRAPELCELYEKLFDPLEGACRDAASEVQILEKCFFKLLKKEVL